MPLNTRASFTLSTPSMAGRIAGLLQSSLQMAVTAVCYFPMISWWLAYITVNIYWKNIHAHNMLFLRLTTSRALFYLTRTWYDVLGRLVSLPFLIPEPFKEKRHGSCRWFLAQSDDGEWLMIVRHRLIKPGTTCNCHATFLWKVLGLGRVGTPGGLQHHIKLESNKKGLLV